MSRAESMPRSTVEDLAPSPEHWTTRLYEACTTVVLMVELNALWLLFTVLGGVALGLAPATVAAAHCVREHRLARLHRPAAVFARTWRAEFVAANLTLAPPIAVLAALAWNYLVYAADPETSGLRLATFAALITVLAAGCWLPGLSVHYDLPRWRLPIIGLRFALANPVPTVLQLLVLAAIAYVSSFAAVLPLAVSAGAWLYLSTWLALRCFAQNEARREQADPTAAP